VAGQQDRVLPDAADAAASAHARPLPEPGRHLPAPDRVLPPDRGNTDRHPPGSGADKIAERLWRLPPGHPSSPYDVSGALRPPVPDYRQFERPLPGESGCEGRPGQRQGVPAVRTTRQHEIRNEHVSPPGSPGRDAVPREPDGQSWREALPRLRELWRKHEEKWPGTERPAADRSRDEPGSWRSDSGHYLNAEENLVADHARQRLSAVEEKTTRTLTEIEAKIPGAGLVGLQFSVKGEDRFKEKVAEEVRAKPERSIGEVAERMPDALRYTYQVEAACYTDGYWQIRQLLQEKGNEILMSRNSWQETEYKGINTRWLSPSGQVFEVQFHTPESYQAKELTHKAYERLRSRATSAAERPLLEAFQREVCALVAAPLDAVRIPDYRKDGY
jgi:hypothetical protein